MGDGKSTQADALAEIARIAIAASQSSDYTPSGGEETGNGSGDDASMGCRIKALPARLNERAAQVAAQINPVNAPLFETAGTLVDSPQRLTITTQKYWGPRPRRFSVSFMETTPADLRAKIVSHLNAWSRTTGMSFAETSGIGQIRISRGPGGYYSYLGTDITLIPKNRQTMNLQNFTMSTPDSEFRRVVRHEAGHSLGFPHEHMRAELVARIDPAKAYPYFLATQGWSKEMVDQQVLTALDKGSIFGTAPDQDSIMCYQLPGQITFDGRPIRGGADINATDAAFAGLVYPKLSFAPGSAEPAVDVEEDWDPADDVLVPV